MSKLIGGIAFMYLVFSMLVGFMNGQGGIATTILAVNMTASDTSCEVGSTAGFLETDKVTIDEEQMTYTSTDYTHFYGLSRGYNNTTAAAHYITNPDGYATMVYSQPTALINSALGFNVSTVAANSGIVSIFTIPWRFFTITLPNLVSGRSVLALFPGEFAFIGYFWLAMTMGIVVSLGVAFLWVLSGVVGRLIP
jgi:hypothetical protein